jgi:thioesterase domain-containing protein
MPHDPALQALAAHYQAMPPVAALQLRIAGFDGDCLRLRAPLSAHVNDKGCAFGGSLGSLMTLAGWGLVTLRLQQAGLAAEVYVADSSVRYRAPLYADLEAEAWLDDGESWEAAGAALREHGRARLFLQACVRLPGGGVAAEGRARFVAVARAD